MGAFVRGQERVDTEEAMKLSIFAGAFACRLAVNPMVAYRTIHGGWFLVVGRTGRLGRPGRESRDHQC